MLEEDIRIAIEQRGHQIIWVGPDPERGNPQFAYTIGLTARVGIELLIFGLSPQLAADVLGTIAKAFDDTVLDVPTRQFTTLPLLLKTCNTQLGKLHDEIVLLADNFYGRKVDVVQVLLPDEEGRTPLDAAYDHEGMAHMQLLFVDFQRTLH